MSDNSWLEALEAQRIQIDTNAAMLREEAARMDLEAAKERKEAARIDLERARLAYESEQDLRVSHARRLG